MWKQISCCTYMESNFDVHFKFAGCGWEMEKAENYSIFIIYVIKVKVAHLFHLFNDKINSNVEFMQMLMMLFSKDFFFCLLLNVVQHLHGVRVLCTSNSNIHKWELYYIFNGINRVSMCSITLHKIVHSKNKSFYGKTFSSLFSAAKTKKN